MISYHIRTSPIISQSKHNDNIKSKKIQWISRIKRYKNQKILVKNQRQLETFQKIECMLKTVTQDFGFVIFQICAKVFKKTLDRNKIL